MYSNNSGAVPLSTGVSTSRGMQLIAAAFLGSALYGCVSNPIPKDYQGDLSTLADTAGKVGKLRAHIYYVEKVNGKAIADSLSETIAHNSGRGFALDPLAISRRVPSGEMRLTLVGTTHDAAPVISLLTRTEKVEGDVTLKAEPGITYVVQGFLSPNYSAVWVENSETGKRVTELVETGVRAEAEPCTPQTCSSSVMREIFGRSVNPKPETISSGPESALIVTPTAESIVRTRPVNDGPVNLTVDTILYAQPKFDSPILLRLPAGTQVIFVRVMETAHGKWAYVKVGSRAGWILNPT